MTEQLTIDEQTLLMIMREGPRMLAIGRWEKTILSLYERGLVNQQTTPGGGTDYGLTYTGRELIDGYEDNEMREVIEAHNQNVTKIRDVGPHVVGGNLFFKMSDGSSISCECIKDPYASQIVEMWRRHAR